MEVMLQEILKLINLVLSDLFKFGIISNDSRVTAIHHDSSLQAETMEADVVRLGQSLCCLNDDTYTLSLQLIDILFSSHIIYLKVLHIARVMLIGFASLAP